MAMAWPHVCTETYEAQACVQEEVHFVEQPAYLAQSVERTALNRVVGGSSPPVGVPFFSFPPPLENTQHNNIIYIKHWIYIHTNSLVLPMHMGILVFCFVPTVLTFMTLSQHTSSSLHF